MQSQALVVICYFVASSLALLGADKKIFETLNPVPTFCDIAESCGQPCEVINITTEDGYILQNFHIPGDASRSVLLIHGILESSDAFIQRENISLAITLAIEGYDVWAVNNRGNRYSRQHVTLNPDTDAKFWDYSFHEMGVFDIPATIDYILEKTGETALRIVGHSEGTTMIFILTSEKPEYNDKIKVLTCLAPVAYIGNAEGQLSVLIPASRFINVVGDLLQYDEILGFYSDAKSILRKTCKSTAYYALCVLNGIFPGIGYDPPQFEPEFLPTFISYFPAGTSRKNLYHFGQIGSRKEFARYDYGLVRNIETYGSTTPPKYDFNKMKIDVALFRGANDLVSMPEDVDRLRRQLPNVVADVTLEYDLWNHLDHIIGLYMPKYLYPHLLGLLKKYN